MVRSAVQHDREAILAFTRNIEKQLPHFPRPLNGVLRMRGARGRGGNHPN